MKKIFVLIIFIITTDVYSAVSNDTKIKTIFIEEGDILWIDMKGGSMEYGAGNPYFQPRGEYMRHPENVISYCKKRDKDAFHVTGDFVAWYKYLTVKNYGFIKFICANSVDEVKKKYIKSVLSDANKNIVKGRNKVEKKFYKLRKKVTLKAAKQIQKNGVNWGCYVKFDGTPNRRFATNIIGYPKNQCKAYKKLDSNPYGYVNDMYWKDFSNIVLFSEDEIIAQKKRRDIRIEQEKKFAEKKKKEKPKKQEPKKQTPKIDDNKVVAASSGTGFFVSKAGHIISNHHVIEGCNTVKLTFKGKEVSADVLASDKMNDLAILKANLRPSKVYPISKEDPSLLEDIIIAGYPLGKKVSAAIKTSKGSITALAGYGDNYSEFQTDASLNQGNSGGPIMDQKGNVVGVAVANYGKKAGVESFNFGIKSSTLKTFANANGLKFLPPNNRDLSNKDLGQLITEATIYLECHMTVAKIKRMIAEEKNRKAFFSEYQ